MEFYTRYRFFLLLRKVTVGLLPCSQDLDSKVYCPEMNWKFSFSMSRGCCVCFEVWDWQEQMPMPLCWHSAHFLEMAWLSKGRQCVLFPRDFLASWSVLSACFPHGVCELAICFLRSSPLLSRFLIADFSIHSQGFLSSCQCWFL